MLLMYVFPLSGLLSVTLVHAGVGDFGWAKAMGGIGNDTGTAIAVDSSGNVYTTGTFDSTADFDPGPGTFYLTPAGNSDIFVSKLDSNGNFVWAKAMGGTDEDYGSGIALDASGNVYTTGYFIGTADFDPGPGTFNLPLAVNSDIFVSKLDSNGDFVWAKAMGGISWQYGNAITVDTSGNVYTTGPFNGSVDFDPGPGTFNLTGDSDIFVSKLDSSGNFVWAKAMGGTGSDSGNAITVDSSGNVYTTGNFYSVVDFDPGAETFNLESAGFDDIFVSKLDSKGDFVWAKAMGGTSGEEVAWGIAVDSSGNVYTTGYFVSNTDFDPGAGTFNLTGAGNYDIFISKLDSGGNFVWAKAMGGTQWDQARGITLDSFGNVYTTGSFSGTADFDPGTGTFNLTGEGGDYNFISKLDSNGNFVWAKVIGGYGKAITLDTLGNVYTTGYFNGTADFDPGPDVFNLTGDWDIFVVRLNLNLPTSYFPWPMFLPAFTGKTFP